MDENTFRKLSQSKHKGDNGCVIVIGGSEVYTGAPVFTAQAAMFSGAEIVYILTDEAAMIPIKSVYDAIVMPISFDERVLIKATACVVGPGLGRCSDEKYNIILKILKYLDNREIPIVIDGDAIHYYKHSDFNTLTHCVITPNYKEAEGLNLRPGHIGVFKGEEDRIVQGEETASVSETGSGKRCAGQGDILAGILAVSLSLSKSRTVKACSDSCVLVRKSACRAFQKLGYSVTASKILEEIPGVLEEMLKNIETYF